jgi:colicin import membrane protein
VPHGFTYPKPNKRENENMSKLKITGKYAAIIIASMVFGANIGDSEPETVTETVTKEVKVEDTKKVDELQAKLDDALAQLKEKPVSAEPKPEPAKKEEPKKKEGATLSQQNAVEKAESYLEFTAFSKTGLIGQLEFEGFSKADSEYAVNNITVDWNEQAVLKAESYLEFTSFSKQGLIDQLKFEGFTPEQAEHGASAVGL